jgi:tripartite-type tricarboxylate transporter receptor subunit TctC
VETPLTKFVPATVTERVAGLVRLPTTAELGVSVEIVGRA